jgi:hypothetical protein
MTEREWHRKQAVLLFNQTWRLLEKRHRRPDEDLTMVHMAHASRYHWGIVGKPVNLAIGEWQVSHVYAVLRRPEPATYHAKRSLALCQKYRIGDFPRAFAYEALARAAAVAGRAKERDRYVGTARRLGERIADREDRELFVSDLATIPGARRRKGRS